MKIEDGFFYAETNDDDKIGKMLMVRFEEINLPRDTFKHKAIADEFLNGECLMVRKLSTGNSIVSILRKKQ